MELELEDRVAIVTGAGRGIGKAVARKLTEAGGHVIIADIDEDLAGQTVEDIRRTFPHTRGFAVRANVADSHDVQAMVRTAVDRLGTVHILVNNAGINPLGSPVVDMPEEVFDRIVAVNLKGPFLCSKAVGKIMTDQKWGKIVNIGSWWGKKAYPLFATYSATKAALHALTQALALEMMPHNVTVTAVCPGYVDTEMHQVSVADEAQKLRIPKEEMEEREKAFIPMRRYCSPLEVADIVLFLCSPQAEYMSGQTVNFNGGILFD